jgi:hypothetical protein
VPAGILTIPATFQYIQTAGVTENNGWLVADSIDILGGSLSGRGTVQGNVALTNAAIVSSNSTLRIQGDLTLTSGSHYRYTYLGGTPLEITGNVALAGTLELDIPNDIFVGSTEYFTVVHTSSSITGTFSNAPEGARVRTLDGTGSFLVAYGTDSVILYQFQHDPPPAQLLNISTRGFLGGHESPDRSVLIGGFIIRGFNEPKTVVLRGLGPSLAHSGVARTLTDPILELRSSAGDLIASNDNWKDGQQSEITANGLAPSDDREAAIVATLSYGSYTVVLREKNGLAGTGLVEVYDVSNSKASKLANISTRGFVDDNNVLIGGIIAVGNGVGLTDIVVRAIGPQLESAGVSGALQDPTLEVRDSDGNVVAFDDDWSTTDDQLMRSGLNPSNKTEAAMLLSLPAGNYTAIVRPKLGATGVALVEVYDLRS